MKNLIPALILTSALCSCSAAKKPADLAAPGSPYLSSGTIVLSRQVPSELTSAQIAEPNQSYSPVVGYIPPLSGILPASNEFWVEIDTHAMTVSVFRGDEKVKSVQAEGTVPLAPGKYALQYKQKFPTWYAPNSYFEKRKLDVPSEQDKSRFRKGALGDYALYPTSEFAIHCSPVPSSDVGGIRLPKQELSSLFQQLPLGTSVVVK